MAFMHDENAPEEAAEITDDTIEWIEEEYDVDRQVLTAAKGMIFVGEIGCEYWYGFLTKDTFNHRYEYTDQMGRIGTIVTRKERVVV